MIVDWEVPFWLETPSGILPINQTLGTADTRRFQLNPASCDDSLGVRITDDDVPQADGKIPHRRFRSGYGVTLAIEPFESYDEDSGEGEPACDAILQEMTDLLAFHVNETIRTGLIPGLPNARLIWQPAGASTSGERMLDRLQLAGTPARNLNGSLGGTQFVIDWDSPYPYYMSHDETDTTFYGAISTETITNEGNTDFFPVLEAYGPFSTMVFTNNSVVDMDANPLALVYDSTLPGAVAVDPGDYLEISFFRGTCYLNGNVARRLAGIDFTQSDFFPLVPGDNELNLDFGGGGGGGLLKWNSAWA